MADDVELAGAAWISSNLRTRATMKETTQHAERVRMLRRIIEQYGSGDLDLLARWDGIELVELAEFLSEEEYRAILEEFGQRVDGEAQ